MRARNIKPGLFKNEILGSADPLFTVIFEGLWCLADREGRLEDRPLRIHAEVNPYRPSASTVQALDWLGASKFIIRYTVDGVGYIQIANFSRHQQPHMKEAASKIPPFENQVVGQARCEHGASTMQARLIPDTGYLIPSSSGAQALPTKKARAKAIDWTSIPGLDQQGWAIWLEYRRLTKRKPYVTDRAARRLAQYPAEVQAEAIDDAITHQWQGVFPEKVKVHGPHQQSARETAYERSGRKIREWCEANGVDPAVLPGG